MVYLQIVKWSATALYAVYPNGEGAVLKTVGCKRLAGSNPAYSVSRKVDDSLPTIQMANDTGLSSSD